jgi:Flp pilus assembly protein protease CpaA
MIVYKEIEITILVIVTLIYAFYDVFNRRNVPNWFVYLSLAIGIAVAVALNFGTALVFDIVVAGVIGAFGYVFYRGGLLGGGDVIEFVFISLVLPRQLTPFYSSSYQFGIPFIISVIVAAGYFSLLFIPIYYVGIKGRRGKPPRPDMKKVRPAIALIAAYIVFTILLQYAYGMALAGEILIIVLAVASAFVLIYEKYIYLGMVDFIRPGELEHGDMIAVNLLDKRSLAALAKRSRHFGRLATKNVIKELSGSRIKLPVYRDSVPFSVFIFIGVVVSLLFGNLIFIIIGI